MGPEDLKRLHALHKVEGSGPITASEGRCFLRAIEKHRPRAFIELGTSSGLSTGLLALMLHDNGGERLVSVDASERFYRDDERSTGFLVSEMYDGDRVTVELRSPMTSLDVASWEETFEMGFVDANHQHPWPLIDTLCILPRLSGPRLLFHHDLNVYKKQRNANGVGPKYLFDQFPDSHRTRYAANGGNLFSLSLDLPAEQIEAIATEAFALPWTGLRWKRGQPFVEAFRGVLARHYSSALLDAFNETAERFALDGARSH
ncbi:MAG TPA: class I SAM-dependent methyltransferase [Nocardioides sp.]|nr:class I SAM-dependent methyltransferase [Nocardioides sp.]